MDDARPPGHASTGEQVKRWEWLAGAGGATVVLIVLAAAVVLPYLRQARRVATEVPQPAPIFAVSLVELKPKQQACEDQVGLLPGRQTAEMRIGTFGKTPSPLRFTLAGAGYRETVQVAPTYMDNGLVDVPFDGPSSPLAGSVCVTNRGRTRVALYAAGDRTKSRSATTVDGRLWPSNFDLAFYAASRESLLDRASAIVGRLRLFHAHLATGLVWLLAILFVIGVPFAATAAVVGSLCHRGRRGMPGS